MKTALIALAFLFSINGFAGEVSVQVEPQFPPVMENDYQPGQGEEIIRGRWFQGDYSITNNSAQSITVTGMEFKVISWEGDVITSTLKFESPKQIEPAGELQVKGHYVQSLPQSETYEYDVELSVQGWIGTVAKPGDQLKLESKFLTQ